MTDDEHDRRVQRWADDATGVTMMVLVATVSALIAAPVIGLAFRIGRWAAGLGW